MTELPLSAALRERSASLHRTAERSGIVRDILRGAVTHAGYALYLRNLLPAYAALEAGLLRQVDAPALRGFGFPLLFRGAAIAADMAAMCGPGWQDSVALLPAATAYAAAIGAADTAQLIGHAYTRYLGDLSGARMLGRSLARTLDLPAAAMGFFAFPGIADAEAFKADFRAALDDAGADAADPEAIIAAALDGFAANIAISEAVAGCVPG